LKNKRKKKKKKKKVRDLAAATPMREGWLAGGAGHLWNGSWPPPRAARDIKSEKKKVKNVLKLIVFWKSENKGRGR